MWYQYLSDIKEKRLHTKESIQFYHTIEQVPSVTCAVPKQALFASEFKPDTVQDVGNMKEECT